MASRRLALNLQQGLRNRAALKSIQPLTRGLATPVSHGAKTESTTLSNGFTVSYLLRSAQGKQLTVALDCHGALSMGANLDCWRLDRRWKPSRDRQDQRHRTLPRAPCFQGTVVLTWWKIRAKRGHVGHPEAKPTAAGAGDRKHGWPPQRIHISMFRRRCSQLTPL